MEIRRPVTSLTSNSVGRSREDSRKVASFLMGSGKTEMAGVAINWLGISAMALRLSPYQVSVKKFPDSSRPQQMFRRV